MCVCLCVDDQFSQVSNDVTLLRKRRVGTTHVVPFRMTCGGTCVGGRRGTVPVSVPCRAHEHGMFLLCEKWDTQRTRITGRKVDHKIRQRGLEPEPSTL